jgi:hypothetical protein
LVEEKFEDVPQDLGRKSVEMTHTICRVLRAHEAQEFLAEDGQEW